MARSDWASTARTIGTATDGAAFTEVDMHQRRRRLALLLGASVLAIAAVFPATAAAEQITPARGDHVWSGTTCAGAHVSIAYHVGRWGRITLDDIDGGRARVVRSWYRLFVRFRGTTTRVWIRTHWRRGQLHLHVDSSNGECPAPPPGEDPPAGDPPPTDDPGNNSPPG
jgi:hypothetical protein